MLKVGDKAPVFELPDASMEMLDLSTLIGARKVVLFFYTRDNAPQCTAEAIEFSDIEDEFARHDAVVMGVSRDNFLSHADFRDKHGLSAQLLSDEDGEVCRRYGVLVESQLNGVVRCHVERVTYVIDRDGIVCHVVPVQHVRGHAAEVLKLVKEMK
jgi:thioredoxin-dependent peroxiredoxin